MQSLAKRREVKVYASDVLLVQCNERYAYIMSRGAMSYRKSVSPYASMCIDVNKENVKTRGQVLLKAILTEGIPKK